MGSGFDYHIRAAQAQDDEALLALCARLVEMPLPSHRRRQDCVQGFRRDLAADLESMPTGTHVLVAEEVSSGRCAGFARVRLTHDPIDHARCAHLADWVVDAGDEGRGVGAALLDAVQALAEQYGCVRLQLFVFPGNARALQRYRQHGFETDLLRLVKPLR